MRARLPLLLLLLSFSSLAACGSEAGRVPLSGEGAGTVTMPLKAGDVAFWTDLDLAYEGDAALAYRVELVQDGATVASAVCNPLGHLPMKMSWRETNIGSSHTRRGSGKMECTTKLAKGGPTTVKATLAFAQKPAGLALKKADLVIKQ